ncbi:Protein of unknown function [Halopseudomonas sabulinigri]|uniref:DUF3509 domain-containing protein n=1 Tax=Halopseudomonas sabulinigri TaxID=472181 RepID=A0A1H1PCK8_9GAMM|nr:DUF3509 domain-containing protein [Halopseudomonas sabulinigri]SDS09038.1 Protein of unknown function [Halopseudomonas sabulinigri]
MQRDLTPFYEAFPDYHISCEPRPDGNQLLVICDKNSNPVYRRVLLANMSDAQLISRIKLDLFVEGHDSQRDLETLLTEVKQQSYTGGELHRTKWDRLWEERKLTITGRPPRKG